MKGFDLFKIYLGVKLHFTTDSYDFLRFGGKTKTTFDSYLKRSDKYWFERLSRSFKGDPVDFFFALFAHNPHQWIGQMMEGGHEEIYTQWQRRMQNFSEEFGEDMANLCRGLEATGKGFDSLFCSDGGQHPPLLQAAIRGEISPESFIALDEILGFFPQFNKSLQEDALWNAYSKRCEKYRPFLRSKGVLTNTLKHRKILREKLQDSGVGA
jgi:hypothetical protein